MLLPILQQAIIYQETNRVHEAYKTYEELLFADYQRVNAQLQGMYALALQEKDRKKAHFLVDKQVEMAKCFDMGRYYEVSPGLELAVQEKDKKAVEEIGKEMLSSVDQMCSFRESPLYEHMEFKAPRREFLEGVKENLKKCLQEIAQEMEGNKKEPSGGGLAE